MRAEEELGRVETVKDGEAPLILRSESVGITVLDEILLYPLSQSLSDS